MKDAFNEAAIFAEYLEGKTAALKIVEYAGVVAGDVHAATEGGEVYVHSRFLTVTAKDNRVCLHVVFEVLTLKLGESRFYFAAAGGGPHCGYSIRSPAPGGARDRERSAFPGLAL